MRRNVVSGISILAASWRWLQCSAVALATKPETASANCACACCFLAARCCRRTMAVRQRSKRPHFAASGSVSRNVTRARWGCATGFGAVAGVLVAEGGCMDGNRQGWFQVILRFSSSFTRLARVKRGLEFGPTAGNGPDNCLISPAWAKSRIKSGLALNRR